MSVDNTKAQFSSEWDVDQLLEGFPATASISANTDTLIYTFADAAKPPIFEVQFQTGSLWYQPGGNSTGNTSSSYFSFLTWTTGTGLYVWCQLAGTVRYYIWSDTYNV